MTKLKTVELSLPATREELAKLEIGTVVYLSGRVHTAREGVYKRAVEEHCNVPDAIGTASFHCSPAASVGPNGELTVGAVRSFHVDKVDSNTINAHCSWRHWQASGAQGKRLKCRQATNTARLDGEST